MTPQKKIASHPSWKLPRHSMRSLAVTLSLVLRVHPAATAETSFVLLHDEQEGSHALVEALAPTCCLDLAGRREEFDARANRLGSSIVQAHMLRAFFTLPAAALAGAVEKHVGRSSNVSRPVLLEAAAALAAGKSGCPCVSRGALVRADAATVCRLGRETLRPSSPRQTRLLPFVLARTDLLRVSLSRDPQTKAADGGAHPQFARAALRNASRRAPTHYSLAQLDATAKVVLDRWRALALKVRQLQACGLEPRLLVYEIFDELQAAPASLLPRLLPCSPGATSDGPPRPPASSRCLPRQRASVGGAGATVVHKAHSHRISEFVANAAEVHRHFISAGFPSFADVLRKHKIADLATLIMA